LRRRERGDPAGGPGLAGGAGLIGSALASGSGVTEAAGRAGCGLGPGFGLAAAGGVPGAGAAAGLAGGGGLTAGRLARRGWRAGGLSPSVVSVPGVSSSVTAGRDTSLARMAALSVIFIPAMPLPWVGAAPPSGTASSQSA
jgi:hypothetical protein